MKIIFASYACCARVIKEGIALIEAGHNVIFIQQTMANWDLLKGLPLTSFYGNPFTQYAMPKHFVSKLSLFTEVDLIHVHNEPSWLGYVAKEARPDIPVIFDAHDLDAVRYGKATIDEKKSIGACDAIIFPSKSYQRYCCGSKDFTKYKKKKYTSILDKPTEVVYSMCNEYAIDLPSLPRLPGIVYQGGLSIDSGYRDWRDISLKLSKKNIPFHIYAATMDYIKEYSAVGAICLPTIPYLDLIKNLSRYDWGLVGFPINCDAGNTAMPNKLFEYIAAGIPCLVYQSDEAAEFVQKNELGIVIDDINDIPGIYDQHEKFRKIVQTKKHEFTMKTQVDKILKLYKACLNGNSQ
jgi:hypothetical protein